MRAPKLWSLLLLGASLVVGHAVTVGGQDPADATISGHAYTFNTRNVIAGATIRAVEHPEVSTTTAADGSYRLTFPVGSAVTLSIEADGHDTIHLQTFRLDEDHDGTAVVGANFQTPTHAVYGALRALVASYLGHDPFDDGCVIVTTVGMAELAGMPFDEFIRFAPHGVAGATASLTPAATSPIYFNSAVIPDPTQLTTSDDGGVLWPNVPPGTYELSAQHPDVDFRTATVRCELGWVVNANPVWGLHALDPATTTTTTTAPLTTTTSAAASSTSIATSTSIAAPTATIEGTTATSGIVEATTAPKGPRPAGAHEATRTTPTGTLARTGTDARRPAVAGAALVAVGAALVAVARRRTAAR